MVAAETLFHRNKVGGAFNIVQWQAALGRKAARHHLQRAFQLTNSGAAVVGVSVAYLCNASSIAVACAVASASAER
jgi:hypothetical protein